MASRAVDVGLIPGESRLSGRVAFAGGALALLLLIALHALRPDLEPSTHFISEYAVGPAGWVMALCFLSLAIGCIGVLAVLAPRTRTALSRIGLFFMILAAIGLTMAVFFPMDPITVAPENASFSGRMHGVAAMIGNPGFMIGALLLTLALRRHTDWARLGTPLVAVTALIWIAFALMMYLIMGMMQQEGASTSSGAGWANRLLWAAYCAWIMLVAWPFARGSSTSS